MNESNYSNIDIVNLVYIHGECNKILNRIFYTVDEIYLNFPQRADKMPLALILSTEYLHIDLTAMIND